jgi:rare lipoprotein A
MQMRIEFARQLQSRGALAVAALASIFLFLPGCGKKHRNAVASVPHAPRTETASKPMTAVPVGYTEVGVASWYGHPYHGRPAADGEIYDMEKLVAAHRLMPFNTWVRVTNLQNGKTIDVRIIDRGPFVEGRIIDLSKAAARQIDLLGPGVGRVQVQVIAAPVDVPADDLYAVQIGAFSVQANAESAREDYARRYGTARLAIRESTPPLWRVLVGSAHTLAAAQQLATALSSTDRNVFVVRLDPTTQGGAPVPPPAVPIVSEPSSATSVPSSPVPSSPSPAAPATSSPIPDTPQP